MCAGGQFFNKKKMKTKRKRKIIRSAIKHALADFVKKKFSILGSVGKGGGF